MPFDKPAYQKAYLAREREKARKLKALYEIFKSHARAIIRDGITEKEREILKEVEKLVDMG